MHGAKRKIFHHAYNLILYGCVEPDLRHCSAHYFGDRLTKCSHPRFVYDHRIAIVEIANLEITSGNKL